MLEPPPRFLELLPQMLDPAVPWSTGAVSRCGCCILWSPSLTLDPLDAISDPGSSGTPSSTLDPLESRPWFLSVCRSAGACRLCVQLILSQYVIAALGATNRLLSLSLSPGRRVSGSVHSGRGSEFWQVAISSVRSSYCVPQLSDGSLCKLGWLCLPQILYLGHHAE